MRIFPFILLAVVAFACGGNADSGESLVIKASDQLRFEPTTLTVKVGESVRIRLDNTRSATLHDFSVDAIPASSVEVGQSSEHGHGAPIVLGTAAAPQIHIAAEAGKSAVVEFIPTQPGRYAFYCSVSGHRQGGMEGIIVVEPA